MKFAKTAIFALSVFPAFAVAADSSLLSLMMPDAKVIAGVQVDSAKNSPFGRFLLAHFQPSDQGFQDFMTQTGFDPRRDVTEVVMASNWQSNTAASRWLVAAKGAFDLGKITQAVQAHGGTVQNFQGVTILSSKNDSDSNSSIAFLDGSSAVIGDVASVQGAIQRRRNNTPADPGLIAKLGSLRTNNDFWFTTLVSISEFADSMPNENLQGAMKGSLMQGITQASGGIKFGPTVNISGEAVTRSERDAQALMDVIRFLMSMIQQNKTQSNTTAQVSDWLDSLDLKSNGTTVTMALAIPEPQLEQFLDTARSGAHTQPRKRVAPQQQ
jgi:hypothetical protein